LQIQTARRFYTDLDAQLREGAQPSGYQRVFGKSLWEYFGERPEAGARFADAMRQLTAIEFCWDADKAGRSDSRAWRPAP
jgi:hypothetical protein